MTSANTKGLVTDIAGLRDQAGTHVGYTDWQKMTQEIVNQFADATGLVVAHVRLTLQLPAPAAMVHEGDAGLRVPDITAV